MLLNKPHQSKCSLFCAPGREWKRTRRAGAINCMELLFVLPVLLIVVFAILEFGCLWSANLRVKAASQAACRVATLPAATPEEMMLAVQRMSDQSLGNASLVRSSKINVQPAEHSGDPVTVEVRVPMSAAAPDMLAVFGLELKGRELIGRTVMRKE